MAQFGRPEADITQTNWSGGFGTIDEASANDADYITGSSSANGTAEYRFSDVTDPAVSTGHVVRFRAWQQNNSHQRTLDVTLYQGATLKSTYTSTITLSKAGVQAYTWTLSGAEADAISDYTDLRIRFVSGGETGTPAASRSAVYVSWAELQVPANYSLACDGGSFALTGGATALKAGRKLACAGGSFALTGGDVALKADRKLACAGGSFALTGGAVTLVYSGEESESYTLACAGGSYALTGGAVALRAGRRLVCEGGSFAVTGGAVGLKAGRKLAIGTGSFALTGQDVALRVARKLVCGTGSYALTGSAVTLRAGRKLACTGGAYTLTGIAASLLAGHKLACGTGSYTLTGQAVTLTYQVTEIHYGNATATESAHNRAAQSNAYHAATDAATLYYGASATVAEI